MKIAKKLETRYLPLAAVLITAVAVVAAPFQQASAQVEDARFIIRIIQGATQAGLVNLNVQVGNIDVIDDVTVEINRNVVNIPITVQVAANVAVAATVCAEILSGPDAGQEVCQTIQEVEQNARNIVILDLDEAE